MDIMDIVEAQKIKVLRSKSRIVRELANCKDYGYCGSSKNKSSEIKVRIGERPFMDIMDIVKAQK